MNTFKGKKKAAGFLLASAGLITMMNLPVHADDTGLSDTDISSLPVYEIHTDEQNLFTVLKEEAIQKYIASQPTMTMDDVDMEASTLDVTTFNQARTDGLQTVELSLNIVPSDTSDGDIGISYAEKAAVKMIDDEKPTIILKSSEMTVDLGSTFNYTDNIGYINSVDSYLPASITETDNVDVNTEGTYNVSITALDHNGKSSTVSYTVNVKKPAEVIRAEQEQAAAAAKAQEEAAAAAAAEAEAQAAAEAAAQEAAASETTVSTASASVTLASSASYAGTVGHDTGDSGNAYPWGQCTWYAYERRHQLGLPCGSYFGNAASWAASAAAYGYAVDHNAQVGDIVVFAPGQAYADATYGHVAVVEAVSGDTITISESNAKGLGVISSRTLSGSSQFTYIHS